VFMVTQDNRQCLHSIERIRLSIYTFRRNCLSLLYYFRNTVHYFSKVANFYLHVLHVFGDPVEVIL